MTCPMCKLPVEIDDIGALISITVYDADLGFPNEADKPKITTAAHRERCALALLNALSP